MQLQSQRMSGSLCNARRGLGKCRRRRVYQERHTTDRGQQFMHQLQPLRPQFYVYACRAGHVAARPVQARDEPNLHRVGPYCEYDWNSRRCRLRRQRRRRAAGSYKYGYLLLDETCRELWLPISVRLGPSIFDVDVLALDIACLFQPLSECAQTRRVRLRRCAAEKPNHRHPRLLRPRRERPRHRRAAEKRYELAALHYSIISSARPDRGSGTVMPSALAVLRLMISSTFVDCTTGRSAGFSPLRMRPV